MYISIRRYSGVKLETRDEIVRRIEAELLLSISAMPGFVAYYLLDECDGVLAAVSFFASQAAAENADRVTAAWVQERVAAWLAMSPQITLGRVRLACPDFLNSPL